MYEPLERRRLLSADSIAPAEVEPDLPIIDFTSDVVIASGRQQIYPPLAPAMWADESVGSFEEPEAITVAFFPPDPVDEAPANAGDDRPQQDEAASVPPLKDVVRFSGPILKPASITGDLFRSDDGADALPLA